ncbi:NlpC/P60 family protein [Flagellimonas algicola]|uniref:Glycoside hydrolase n=1 Tax=Flagellimonas algicola TaxID=2583815 RepID=A0ABY2WQK6_9FLAO|nr:NlpC/P60 family protein [Allomuricauda algicola]TMU57020.1 glycoside hydrolase [Allomuricauda algicola]
MKYHFVRKIRLSLLVVLTLFGVSCETDSSSKHNAVEMVIDSVKGAHVPDKRIAIFEIDAEPTNDGYIVKGVTNIPEALEALQSELKKQQIKYIDSTEVLPSQALEGKVHGVIKVSVANLRGRPAHSAEMVTQAIMGTPIKIFQKQGSWYRIQTPDQYLGWVDSGGLALMNQIQFDEWQDSNKLIYTKTFGNSFEEADRASQMVSDLVFGNILRLTSEKNDFFEVNYADGKKAYVSKSEAAPYQAWKTQLPYSKEALVATSKKMLGVPYLWGGTSAKGVDCSGFTKTVYFMNGMIIPRDASQQVHEGVLVDVDGDFSKLVPGDLLFFGRKATDSTQEKATHVGMWIGNNEFIHSAGDVHISSMAPNAENFDEFNRNRYLRSKRLLNQKDKGILYLKEHEVF